MEPSFLDKNDNLIIKIDWNLPNEKPKGTIYYVNYFTGVKTQKSYKDDEITQELRAEIMYQLLAQIMEADKPNPDPKLEFYLFNTNVE